MIRRSLLYFIISALGTFPIPSKFFKPNGLLRIGMGDGENHWEIGIEWFQTRAPIAVKGAVFWGIFDTIRTLLE